MGQKGIRASSCHSYQGHMGNYSMIDPQLCRYLCSDLTPFHYDIPLCPGIE